MNKIGIRLLFACAVTLLASTDALASTINQNVSWTIKRTNATGTYRVVAYGDSIFAGYNGGIFSVAKRSAPHVDGEYLAKLWNANIEVVRRTKSGAKADDIFNNKIYGERSYMQTSNTRVVMFEMCGNDYLQARSALAGQSGTCNYSVLDNAFNACKTYMERGMQAISGYATTAKLKVIANIYYPGYNADNALTNCTDPTTGQRINKRDKFLPLLLHSNWWACNLADQYGFVCADSFAEYMAAEYDSNGDGIADNVAIRYRSGESEDAYVARILALKSTLRDANYHFVNASTSYDYIQSDDTHPTYYGGTVGLNWFTLTGTGSGSPDFSDAQIVGGKNPVWNHLGHEKMGWESSVSNPAAP